jgi:hypothetical protein
MLVALLFLSALGGASVEEPGSARSSEKDGRRIAYLLLEELGFATELWSEPPGLLPFGRHVLWMPRAPEELDPDHSGDPLSQAREGGPFGRGRYREFIEQGGTLVLPSTDEAVYFLAEELGIESGALVTWELEGVPEIPGGELVASFDAGLYELGNDEQLFATWSGVGEGYVALVGDGPWLDNSRIEEGDASVALTRIVEYLAGSGEPERTGARVLFDEHVFGGAPTAGPLSLAFETDSRLLSLHLLLLALLFVWFFAWVREFPRDPEPLDELAPLARARAQSGLLVRAGQAALLADFLRAGTLRRIGARLRGSEPPSGEALTAMVHAVAVERGHPERAADWTAVLADRTVTDLAGLTRLDRQLRNIETEVGVHLESPAQRARGAEAQ